MDWRAVLAAAQAVPPAGPALDELVASLWPGSDVGDVALLPGALGSLLHRVDLVDAPVDTVVLRQLLREFGDDERTVLREVEVHAVAAAAGVPVPEVHWSDPAGERFGRPALLLGFVRGRPLVTDLGTETAHEAMASVVHAIATVEPARCRHVPRLEDLEAVLNRFWPPPEHSAVVDAPGLNASVLASGAAFEARERLVHMDLHAGNALWDGTAVTGVVDWPGASIGNPLFDECYLWLDTCLAHGRTVADALQEAVATARPGPAPNAAQLRLWRGIALQRGLPSPAGWTDAYRAMGVDVAEDLVVDRFVALVDEYLQEG